MKTTEKNRKLKKNFVILVVAILVTILFYFAFAKPITRWMYADNIPILPNLNGYPEVLISYIMEKHEAATELPTSDKLTDSCTLTSALVCLSCCSNATANGGRG